jgi:hypothetical protein
MSQKLAVLEVHTAYIIIAPMTEAVSMSEMSINFYKTAWHINM